MVPFFVYDIEANGLYNDYVKENATHIWCLCLLDEDKNEYVFVKDDLVDECSYDCKPLSKFKPWLKKQLASKKDLGWVCHNQIGYDLRMMNKFLGIDYSIKPDTLMGCKVEIIDTLLDSKWLNPKRALPRGCPGAIKPEDGGKSKIIGPHGLEAWGYRVSKKKPGIEDWEGLHIDQYVNRCIEDTHINYGTFERLNAEIAKYFKGARKLEYWKHNRKKAVMPIAIEHGFKQDIVEQEENGVPLDIEKAESYIPKWDAELEELRNYIESFLPDIPIPPSRLKDWQFPARPFKQDKKKGAVPSAHLEKFCVKHGGDDPKEPWRDEEGNWWIEIEVDGERKQYKAPFPDYIKTTEQMTVESEHLPQYLIDKFGWKPMYWNYKIDPKTKRKVRDEKNNLVPTSPRFKDAQSGRLCPHLESLEIPFIKKVLRYRTIKHRRQTVKSTTNDIKGYLNHPRLDIDGRLPASMDTIGAATSRVTHKIVCNVPKADDDVLYGKELRELFYVGKDPDWYMVGYDASGLEARLEGSEAYKYDGGEYARILTEEDIHQINADYFGIKRSPAKNVKYGLGYGAGANKIGQMLNVSYEKALNIIEDWWEKYWAVKKVIDNLKKQWEATGKRYIIGVDGRPIPMGSPHLALNYRLQNAGTVVMKLHACIMRKKMAKLKEQGLAYKVLDYHDEAAWIVHKSLVKFKKVKSEDQGMEYFEKKNTTKPFKKGGKWWVGYSKVGVMGCQSIQEAGEILGINVPLTGDYQIGKSWADVH